MNKTLLMAAAILTGITAIPATAATEHDNEVFLAIPGITKFEFIETGHAVTSGQPYSGTSAGVSKEGEARIVVKAGRKGSSQVADWFKSKVATGQTLVCDSAGTFPDDLNFAVMGTMKMVIGKKTITCNNIIVAQGHASMRNNWWAGGPKMQGSHLSLTGATLQTCKLEGGLLPGIEVTFSPQTPCVNNFNISTLTIK